MVLFNGRCGLVLKISRLTDYGIMILVHLSGRRGVCSASDVAAATGLALPTVKKLLKLLARGSLVTSVRGADGGYALAKPADQISAAEILTVIEGPVGITECSTGESQCEYESQCRVGGAWQRINTSIQRGLEAVSLTDLVQPPREFALIDLSSRVPGRSAAPARPE